MKKKTLLTIDWDYFIDAPQEVRDRIFPRITEGFRDSIPDNSLWNTVKSRTHKFDMDAFERVYRAFRHCGQISNHIPLYASENHCEAYYIAKKMGAERVINVDFHHDKGIASRMSCDSWMRILHEENPDIEYIWCKREDSVTTCFGAEVDCIYIDFDNIIHAIATASFDAVHLCRSDLYSPPVYDAMFGTLLKGIQESLNTHVIHVGNQSIEVRRKFI